MARKLTRADIEAAAEAIGCDVAAVRAVMAVEARGSGFDAAGRPVILTEGHIFWRELGAGGRRGRAAREGLAWRRWGEKPYPRTADARWARLAAMRAIDRDAADRSTSWGLGQLMGFNHKAAGFDDLQDFVAAMHESEGAQLLAMARFIVNGGMAGHLRRRDWKGFAKRYNGPGYARNRYDEKLARAYARFAREEGKADLPAALRAKPDRAPGEGAATARPVLREGARGADVEDLQRALNARLGKLVKRLAIDGDFGPATKRAVKAFQRAKNLTADGIVGARTWAALES